MDDEGAELSLTIVQLVQRLKGSHLHAQMEREARECLHQAEIRLDSIKDDVRSFLRTSGWEKKLQNAVYRELQVERLASSLTAVAAMPPEHVKEPLAYMRKAQAGWERRILKSLNGMSTELGVPLARMRTAAEQRELSSKWNEMGTDEADLSGFRPIYAAKDFLEVVVALRSPNHKCGGGDEEEAGTRSHWGLIQVPLDVQDIQQLRGAYAELNLAAGQLGIDDDAHIHPDFFERDYVETAKKVLGGQDSAAAQQYSRRGCPTGLRADLWALILNSVDRPQVGRLCAAAAAAATATAVFVFERMSPKRVWRSWFRLSKEKIQTPASDIKRAIKVPDGCLEHVSAASSQANR